MESHEFEKNRVYLTPEEYFHFGDLKFLEGVVSSMMKSGFIGRRTTYGSLIDSFSRKTGLEGFAMLYGHGGYRDGVWFIGDEKRTPVQNWIDSLDGERAVIALRICNPNNTEIKSKRSIVLHWNSAASLREVFQGGYVRIYVPGDGYLDGNYRGIKRALERLA
ncbi:MAG: hypothetical protein IH845_01550 [Nanoarchaeota archaeon]|nr:hypothetical protein [Nanoarchaeota archaeon]